MAIIQLASASQWMTRDCKAGSTPFHISDATEEREAQRIALRTRETLALVSRTWRVSQPWWPPSPSPVHTWNPAQDIVKRSVPTGIIRFEAYDADWESEKGLDHVKSLRVFASRVEEEGDDVEKMASVLSVCSPSGSATGHRRRYSCILNRIMKSCKLSALSLTYDSVSGILPGWLPRLVDRSAGSLTHLDIAIDASSIEAETIKCLNSLMSLVWLRIRESNSSWPIGDVEEEMCYIRRNRVTMQAFSALPTLALARLAYLQVEFGGAYDLDFLHCHVPLELACHARLPTLSTLWLTDLGYSKKRTWGRLGVQRCLGALGQRLRHLGVRTRRSMEGLLDELRDQAPCLTDLECLKMSQRISQLDLGRIRHSGVKRLTVSGHGVCRELLEQMELPSLNHVTIRQDPRTLSSQQRYHDARSTAMLQALDIHVGEQPPSSLSRGSLSFAC